jgi:hypothetical protein
MTVQTDAPAQPAPEPAAPAAPAPAVPAQQAPSPPAPQPPAPAPQPPRNPDGTFAQGQPQAQPPAPPADSTDWKAQAEAARAEAARLKQEADTWKAQSRRQEQRSKANHQELQNRDALLRLVAEKVGVEFDDRPDPEILQQRLEAQTTLARQRAVELAVYTQAAQAGTVNAVALLDSREFMTRTSALDPEAADFPSQVADLVKEAAGQPRYQFQQPPAPQPPPEPQQQAPAQPPAPQPPAPSSGADFSGAPGQGSQWTQADYDRYMEGASKYDRDGTVLSKAIEAGLLVNLGIGKPRTRSRR